MFISVEGIDGCGSTTQCEKLKEYLESTGRHVWLTSEPTNSPVGNLIRSIQKGQLVENPEEDLLLYLYIADRAEHQREIKDHLNRGEVVVCDRYKMSSEVYQGFKEDHVHPSVLNVYFKNPDFTLLIDIPEDIALKRVEKRGKPLEIFEKLDFLKKVRGKYCEYSDMPNVYRIDGTKTEDEVFKDIKQIVKRYL